MLQDRTHSLTLCRRCSVSGNDSRWTSPSSGCCWPTRSRRCRTGSPSPTGTSRCRIPRASRLSRRWRTRFRGPYGKPGCRTGGTPRWRTPPSPGRSRAGRRPSARRYRGVEVDQQTDVAPLPPGAHVRQVACDMGARRVPVEAPVEQVRQRGLVRLRAGRPVPLPRVCADQDVLPHDSGDAPPRGHDAAFLQHRLYLRGPVLAEPLLVGPDHVVGDRVARPFALGMPEHPVVRGPGNA